MLRFSRRAAGPSRGAKSGGATMAASQNPHDDIESVLITEAAIDARVRELGA